MFHFKASLHLCRCFNGSSYHGSTRDKGETDEPHNFKFQTSIFKPQTLNLKPLLAQFITVRSYADPLATGSQPDLWMIRF
jgi:hypothetical protein